MKKINGCFLRRIISGFIVSFIFFSGEIFGQVKDFNDLNALIPVDSTVTMPEAGFG